MAYGRSPVAMGDISQKRSKLYAISYNALLWQRNAEGEMRVSCSKRESDTGTKADQCFKTGLYGSLATALCCLTPVLVFLFGLGGLAFVTPYLDYFLVPLFAIFLLLALYGWIHGGKFCRRK